MEAQRADYGLDPKLLAWAEEVLEGRVVRCARTPGGGSRRSYFLNVERLDASPIDAVLRIEGGGSFEGTEINVSREATVYRALAQTPVPVPAVLAVAPGGAAVLLEMLPGSSELGDTPDRRDATLRAFMRVVADLHRIDVGDLDLPGFDRPNSPSENAVSDLQMWKSLADTVTDLDPLIRYAGQFLVAHPPLTGPPTCLVQGDTGPGNFLADDCRVTGLCDMEFAHLGDPMDDLAWVMMRAGRLVPDMTPYLDEYTECSGIRIVQPNLAYYSLAVQYRCSVTTSLAVARGGGARGWAPYLLVTQRYIRGVAAELSSYTGVPDPPVALPEAKDTARTAWYDSLLDGIRAGVRGIPDADLREETRNHQILVHYLRAFDRSGAGVAVLDAADGREALGIDTDSPDELRRVAEEGGAAGDEAVLQFLFRRARRQSSLWQSLLDR